MSERELLRIVVGGVGLGRRRFWWWCDTCDVGGQGQTTAKAARVDLIEHAGTKLHHESIYAGEIPTTTIAGAIKDAVGWRAEIEAHRLIGAIVAHREERLAWEPEAVLTAALALAGLPDHPELRSILRNVYVETLYPTSRGGENFLAVAWREGKTAQEAVERIAKDLREQRDAGSLPSL